MNEDMESFILEMDRQMAKKSFKYFFTEILGFHYSHHHESWEEGLSEACSRTRPKIGERTTKGTWISLKIKVRDTVRCTVFTAQA